MTIRLGSHFQTDFNIRMPCKFLASFRKIKTHSKTQRLSRIDLQVEM